MSIVTATYTPRPSAASRGAQAPRAFHSSRGDPPCLRTQGPPARISTPEGQAVPRFLHPRPRHDAFPKIWRSCLRTAVLTCRRSRSVRASRCAPRKRAPVPASQPLRNAESDKRGVSGWSPPPRVAVLDAALFAHRDVRRKHALRLQRPSPCAMPKRQARGLGVVTSAARRLPHFRGLCVVSRKVVTALFRYRIGDAITIARRGWASDCPTWSTASLLKKREKGSSARPPRVRGRRRRYDLRGQGARRAGGAACAEARGVASAEGMTVSCASSLSSPHTPARGARATVACPPRSLGKIGDFGEITPFWAPQKGGKPLRRDRRIDGQFAVRQNGWNGRAHTAVAGGTRVPKCVRHVSIGRRVPLCARLP